MTSPLPPSSNEHDQPGKPVPFTATPSTRAISFIAITILIGFILVLVVNSDKEETTTAKKSSASKSATQEKTASEDTTTTTTTTTKPVSGTNDPSDVSVLVLNGSNIAGVAGKISDSIGALGYKTLTPGNDTSKDTGTSIYYKSGFEKDAKQLANNVVPGILKSFKITQPIKVAQLPSSAPEQWDQDNLIGANVVVVVGNVAATN